MMKSRRLTLVGRIVLWNLFLIILTGVFLLVSLNVFVQIMLPAVQVKPNDILLPQDQEVIVPTIEVNQVDQEGMLISDVSFSSELIAFKGQVLLFSLICLLIMIILGGVGAFYLSKRSLWPVRLLSERLKKINANDLSVQLPVKELPNDELKELTESFNTMLKKLEHAFQQQERFMANAAHEFRTPLTILKTNLEVLRSDPSATLADYRQLSDIFEKTLKRMNHMVNELLVLAKNNDPDKDVIEVGSLIRKVVSELNDLASTETISIETHIHPDVKIYGNDTLIQRAISNLVENAIMYNKPQGKVIITCTSQEGECFISIMDTGDGIDEKHIPFIFEPFYRTSEGRTKNKAGTGLGLSITLSIIKKHEGTIEYSREQTMKGFIVRLPVID